MAATIQGCDELQVPGANIVASIQQGISGEVEAQGGSDWPDQWGETPDWDNVG